MKKLVSVLFTYEDGSMNEIIDPRAALLFQSRCNSGGLFSGMEECLLRVEEKDEAKPAV